MSEAEPTGPREREATRITPYELAFGDAGFEERLFSAIQSEAEQAGVDAVRYHHFALLHSVSEVLTEIVPPEVAPEARDQHRAILFHAYNFWRFGKRLYLLESATVRYLVEAAPRLGDWELDAPHAALYLQLPAQLFWASIATDSPPEPVDGFFVTLSDSRGPQGKPFRHLHGLMVLGIRRNRAGFSVIPFETGTGSENVAEWAEAPGREQGRDFETVLPGGEMAGMYSILTTLEALKLVARCLWYLDVSADQVLWEEAVGPRSEVRPGTVQHSRLEFHRVQLGAARQGKADEVS